MTRPKLHRREKAAPRIDWHLRMTPDEDARARAICEAHDMTLTCLIRSLLEHAWINADKTVLLLSNKEN